MSGSTELRVVERAAALLIGAELLSGKVRDANLHELAVTLRGLGIELARVVMVTDDEAAIAEEIAALQAAFGVVFTSGGIGPTHDDVTVRAAARAFGVPLVHSAEMEALLRSVTSSELVAAHLRMALVPEGARLAYGPASPWPALTIGNVWLLPGVPEVFRAKLEVVRAHLRGAGCFYTESVYCRSDEALLCPALEAAVAAHPEVAVGSYPQWGTAPYRTHVTFDGRDARAVSDCRARFVALLAPDELVPGPGVA